MSRIMIYNQANSSSIMPISSIKPLTYRPLVTTVVMIVHFV